MIERMTYGSPEALSALAHQHLPSDVAARWVGLLRPAVRLETAAASDIAVGQIGGLPKLPAEVEWPSWEGHGPLSFIASVDCAMLPAGAVDITLPAEGTLSFFYFDGQLDDGEALVLAEDRESRAGARVLYTTADETCGERDAPAGLKPYPRVPLAARPGMTATEPWHPQVRDAFAPGAPLGNRYDHPVCGQDFLDAVWEFGDEAGHQIGGHAHSIQNPVEIEVAEAVTDGDVSWGDPALDKEIGNWVLLAQFDSDDAADMMWGDAGVLYWLIRPQDLAERRFDRAMFTWQCG
ncbi:YwqG family protein [Streptomyces sp. NBC_00091]|uniref:YwqG family protein n=1 Tax=Streptomyces sp. NBC_00091 TaxID=2975648 RepID=UPI002250AF42|nr:YwqG family protein [Streptomyces sp. NBC_00091]MCX5377886.1 YwqG family protein [Streptomyces sp. NBC_00091]